jgi:hypothetical protein
MYFNFYPSDAFNRQVNYISNFYQSFNENLDRSFVYLSKEEMDTYVNNTSKLIAVKLHKGLLAMERKVGK